MVHEIETMLGQDIQSLAWMTPATKQQALVKLQAMTNKIGYPDKWRDYSSVKIVTRDDAVGQLTNAPPNSKCTAALNKIGKPVDRSEWGMTPPTVNAYYSPLHERHQLPGRDFAAAVLRQPHGLTR